MLTTRNLSFARNDQLLFNDIHFDLHPGELLQVRGMNGSGKSTLLRLLAGLLEPHDGNIYWQNQSILQSRDDYQQQLCYVGHQNGIKLYLTVEENLKLLTALATKKSSCIKTILAQFNLSHLARRQALHLSAGQLRRLSLAKLVLHEVRLWILDEPTTALDDSGQDLFMDLLQQHLELGGMAVMAGHGDENSPSSRIAKSPRSLTLATPFFKGGYSQKPLLKHGAGGISSEEAGHV
jgi:heme exporter protein A